MISNLMWFVTAIAVFGTVLNAKGNIKGFYVWLVSNFCFAIYNYYTHSYAQMVLFMLYCATSVWGIFEWRKNKRSIND
jgi:nicotinamide riboside transporter PnuC